jgi:hypothetical protein
LRPMFGTGTAVVDAIVGELFDSTTLVAMFAINTESEWYRGVNALKQVYVYMDAAMIEVCLSQLVLPQVPRYDLRAAQGRLRVSPRM